jgi:hypothetical protein
MSLHFTVQSNLRKQVCQDAGFRNEHLRFWTGAPCSPQRTWAENGIFQMLSLYCTTIPDLGRSLLPA